MKEKTRILSVVSIYHAFNDGAISVIPLLFPVLKSLFDLSYTEVGIITGGGLFVTLITQLLIGNISDTKNKRILLSTGILLLSGAMLIMPHASGFLTLFLFVLLLRFAAGFFHPTGVGWISQTFKRERLDWAMGIQSAFGDFGGFIAISTTLIIVGFSDWKLPFYLWSIAGIFCLFLGLAVTAKVSESFTTNSIERTSKKTISSEIEILKKMKLLIPGFIISGAAWGIIITYLPLLLSERTDLAYTQIGLIVSIWLGIGTIVCVFYGKIQSVIGRKNVVILSYLTVGIVSLVLTKTTDTIILIISMIVLGLSTFLTYPSLSSFLSELTDERQEGKTFGYTFTFQLGGGTVLLFLGGVTADIWGIWTPFMILGVCCLVLTLVYLIYRNHLVTYDKN